MRSLPLRPCLATIAFCLASSPALAQTTVSVATTTPLATSSAGNVTITETGSITLQSGTAVTVNSSNSVSNAGTLSIIPGGDGAAGINIVGGSTGTITNSGSIIVSELYVRPDANSPIAQATNRYGIHLGVGGPLTGTITHSGTISVEGQNSAGIGLDSTLSGSLVSSGTINVFGDNSYGIRTGAVTGDLTISGGVITSLGKGSTGLAVLGNVGGSVTIGGTVQQGLTFTNDNGAGETLTSGTVNVGAPAAWISGDVAGGITVLGTTGGVRSFGNGAGLLIGGASNSTIGALTGNSDGYSVVIAGAVSGNASYNGLNAYGLVVGGKGGNVSLPGGISIAGTVTAVGSDIGATAVLINAGVTATKLSNSGIISTSKITAGTDTSYGIRDLSGTLTSIENVGAISVGGGTTDVRRAIDLSANSSGVTISQHLSTATGAALPSISGDILTGSGNDTLSVSSGVISGNSFFNAGNDQLLLSGGASYNGIVNFGAGTAAAGLSGNSRLAGSIDFGGGVGALTIAETAIFTGSILNGGASSVTVDGGAFASNATGNVVVNSLAVGATGTLGTYIDTATHTSSRIVANSATFTSGAKITATLSSLVNAAGTYNILTANTLGGSLTFDNSAIGLPFIYNGAVTATGNNLFLTIARKSASELGLNRAAAAGYDAIIAAATADTKFSDSLLGAFNAASLQTQIAQLLPDHSGGVYDATTRGSRLVARHLMDGDSLYTVSSFGGWLEPIYWRGGRDSTNVASYSDNGWGLSLGVERITALGRIGLSYAFLKGTISNNGGTDKVKTTQHEFGLFWRVSKGPFAAFARASAAPLSMSGARTFTGTSVGGTFGKASNGSWKGWLFSGTGGVSVDANLGDRFTLRPKGVIDYYRLQENGYTEKGGGPAMDLTVAKRNSNIVSGTATLTAIFRLSAPQRDSRPLSLAIEAGRRTILSGDLGATQANFANGTPFTITPDKLQSAWLGEASIFLGGLDYTFKLAGGGERVAGKMGYSGRFSFSGAF